MNTRITYSCQKHDAWNGKKWTKSINRLGGRAFKEWKEEYFKRSSK